VKIDLEKNLQPCFPITRRKGVGKIPTFLDICRKFRKKGSNVVEKFSISKSLTTEDFHSFFFEALLVYSINTQAPFQYLLESQKVIHYLLGERDVVSDFQKGFPNHMVVSMDFFKKLYFPKSKQI